MSVDNNSYIRLECLKIAATLARDKEEIVFAANRFVDFITADNSKEPAVLKAKSKTK